MSEDTKTVMATLDIEVNATCPHCDYYFDILEETTLNDEGEILGELLPMGGFYNAHRDFEIEDLICPNCSQEFKIKGVEW